MKRSPSGHSTMHASAISLTPLSSSRHSDGVSIHVSSRLSAWSHPSRSSLTFLPFCFSKARLREVRTGRLSMVVVTTCMPLPTLQIGGTEPKGLTPSMHRIICPSGLSCSNISLCASTDSMFSLSCSKSLMTITLLLIAPSSCVSFPFPASGTGVRDSVSIVLISSLLTSMTFIVGDRVVSM